MEEILNQEADQENNEAQAAPAEGTPAETPATEGGEGGGEATAPAADSEGGDA